ncbi:PD-(D/E)XK nuclease family protein [Longimicrobium terrae]|uniref:PD-(D/E)XK endonuclease-like domain-containing protein n=1 Tax=Longimicrobium terrae TaxID=1639882 RepID=A0A841H1E6_9BACT|nr:PD-(D/E)XK nuclease family protein [Longimicrobium terrae]MBB4637504.1 hypothetical protein [Longimicrobium terrae]MBB6071901.1 hypothetical protein [Longimicrobium terrae]NNC30451.1 hypothetical protein [Longimicrobium terrae]
METAVQRSTQLSWSHSRGRLLEECPRAYYWRYYGSQDGWRRGPGTPPDAELAWRLKHLTTLHSVLGQAIHESAREIATAIQERRAAPDEGRLTDQVRIALHAACAVRRADFLRDPKRYPLLQSVYYTGTFDPREVAAVRSKLKPCVRNLLASPVWEAARMLPPEGLIVVDSLSTAELDGTPVYAAPDLVMAGPGGECTFVDWKSGKRGDPDVHAQIATYAWFAQRRLGLVFGEGRWSGRAVYLAESDEEGFTITRLDLMRAEHRIRESVEGMRQCLSDPQANLPKSRSSFPLALPAFRHRCRGCRYFQLCKAELTRPGYGDSGLPGDA